jgi:hypothetical protein
MVVVVAASVSSLPTLSFATVEARAGFQSAAASHANGTAIRAPDTPWDVPDLPQDARSDAQASRSIDTTRSCPAQERPGRAPRRQHRPGRAAHRATPGCKQGQHALVWRHASSGMSPINLEHRTTVRPYHPRDLKRRHQAQRDQKTHQDGRHEVDAGSNIPWLFPRCEDHALVRTLGREKAT